MENANNKILIFGVHVPAFNYVETCATNGYNEEGKLNIIASHICSDEYFVQHDMGITSECKHDKYKEVYPDGYELEYIGCFDTYKEGFNVVESKIKRY